MTSGFLSAFLEWRRWPWLPVGSSRREWTGDFCFSIWRWSCGSYLLLTLPKWDGHANGNSII